jgi:hypothetical protein
VRRRPGAHTREFAALMKDLGALARAVGANFDGSAGTSPFGATARGPERRSSPCGHTHVRRESATSGLRKFFGAGATDGRTGSTR